MVGQGQGDDPLSWRRLNSAEHVLDTRTTLRTRSATAASLSEVRTDRVVMALLFAGMMALYVAVTRAEIYAFDAQAVTAVGRNLVDHHTLKAGGTIQAVGTFIDPSGHSTPYAPYGIGLSLLVVPFYALSKLIGHFGMLESLINPLLTAGATVLVFSICRVLSWSRTHALMAAVAFGALSWALQSTTELFSEPAVTFCAVVMVLGMVRWRAGLRWGPFLTGLGAAASVQFRMDSAVTVCIGLATVPLFVPWREVFRPRVFAALMTPLALSAAALAWYNYLRWGTLVGTQYNGDTWSTPLLHGLRGFLFSPGRSLFIFDPPAVLGVVGLVLLARRDRALAALFSLLLVTRMLFFARWDAWNGAWAWGPRFLLPAAPFLAIAAVEVWRACEGRRVLRTAVLAVTTGLVGVAAVVGFLSVRVPYEQWFQTLYYYPAQREALIPGVNPDYDFVWRASPLPGDVLLLRKGLAVMAPHWWRPGAHPIVGEALLASSGASLGLAFLLAAPRRQVAAQEPATEVRSQLTA